ncbi:Yet3p [Saccharomyces cerevisiae YJM1615]|nr:Yet3p [Saccharomyces cerevisiae YJM1083]AJV20751.1 Yet3p [Saccharomyces cerevisiae YJM1615]
MSLYYTLVFAILVVEIFMFSILALPIPSRYRRPLTLLLLKPFKSSTVQVAIKCILGFILLLFIDCINRVYSIDKELQLSSASQNNGAIIAQDRIEVLSRKFFAQRNMYLTGITLFLTFVVVRTFGLVIELLTMKDIYRASPPVASSDVKKNDSVTAEAAAQSGPSKDDHGDEKNFELLKKIQDIDDEIARLKEKSESLQEEMN